jgi:hypothetical protein
LNAGFALFILKIAIIKIRSAARVADCADITLSVLYPVRLPISI